MGFHEQSDTCHQSSGSVLVFRAKAGATLHGNQTTAEDKIHHNGIQPVSSSLQR